MIDNFTTPDNKDKFAILAAARIVPTVFLYALVLTFLLTFSSTSFDGLQNINESASEGSLGNKVFWFLLLCFTLFVWGKIPKHEISNLNKHVYLLIAYISYAVLSAIWSDVPLISLRRSVQQVIIAFCILSPFIMGIDRKQILHKVTCVLTLFVFINVALIPLFGIADFGYRGICPQKNILGQISVIAFFFCTYGVINSSGKTRMMFLASSLLSIFLCIISNSKTSLGLLLIVPLASYLMIFLASIKAPLKQAFFVIVCILIIYIVFTASILVPFDIYDISEAIFHDRTFTGRTVIWEFAGNNIDGSPYIGYGYGSFWGVGSTTKAIGQGFIGGLLQAHNGFIDIVLELGYFGLVVANLFIFALLKSMLNVTKSDMWLALLLVSCLLFILLNNVMESSLFRGYVPLWVTLLFCSGFTCRDKL